MNRRPDGRVLAGLGVAAVAGAVLAGFMAVGPPAGQRLQRLDDRRAQDLYDISRAVDRYHAARGRLPGSLDELEQAADTHVAIRDPVTRAPYGYALRDGAAYELCAVFALETTDGGLHFDAPFSRREAGRHCFRLQAGR